MRCKTGRQPRPPAGVDRRAWRRIIEHCEDAYPREACGALLGTAEGEEVDVQQAVPLPNCAGDSTRGFRLRPPDVYALLTAEARGACRLLGFYHSHPDAGAEPSGTDRRLAWPEYLYLIVEIRLGRAVRAAVWRLPRAAASVPCRR